MPWVKLTYRDGKHVHSVKWVYKPDKAGTRINGTRFHVTARRFMGWVYPAPPVALGAF